MKGIREYYDKTASLWAETWYEKDEALPKLRSLMAELPANPRVLDLCCGAGYESRHLAQLGAQVVGIDLSENCIAIARERNPGLAFHVDDMRADYAYIGQVDAVVCIAGLVHLPAEELRLAFERMCAVLKPGGKVMLEVRCGTGRIDSQSDVVVDGERYDRSFYGHTLEELTAASEGLLVYERALPVEEPVLWGCYIFAKPKVCAPVTHYIHRVHYYETDRMGVTHHSNYIRMMEEARVAFMAKLGWPYAKMEALGVMSPVTALNVKYIAPTTFDDEVEVRVFVKAFNGVKLIIRYEMVKLGQAPVTVLTGESEHVFLNGEGRFVRMKREMPEFTRLLMDMAEEA